MKRIAVLFIALLAATAIGAQPLSIGTLKGMDAYAPVIVKMLKEAGFDVKITEFPGQPELLRALGQGGVDGAYFLAQPIIAQVKGAVMVPVRLAFTDFCAVATDPGVKVAGPPDLRKYTVGVIKGHTGHAAVTRGLPVVEAANEAEQFKMLAAGRFQVAISVRELIPVMTRIVGIKTYYVQSPPLLRTPTFLALSASRAGIKDKVETVFKRWVEGGQWDKETAKAAP